MAALTNTAENRALDWLLGDTPTAPTTPLQVALLTAEGDDTTPGTEATGGDYERQTLTVSAAVSGTATNSATLTWTGMPAATIVGVEIWDSAGSPIRWWHGPLDTDRTLETGDEFRLEAGALTLTLD